MSWPRRAGRVLASTVVVLLVATLPGCQKSPFDPGSVPGLDRGSRAVRNESSLSGGTLRLVTAGIDSLDPARSYAPGVWNVMRLYTRQLVSFAPAPGASGTVVVPDLATSLGRTTDGGRTWTYTLRPGLRWEGGRPLTSRDVKYGIERLFASDTLAGGPTWAVGLLDDRSSPYDGPYRDRSPGRLGLRSIRTPNDRTVVFTLVRPFADWDQVLALPSASPVPAAKDRAEAYGAKPVSLGPYRIGGTSSKGVITFERNRYWSHSLDPVRTALPDRVELATGILPAERDRRVLTGEADVDVSGSGLQPEAAARVLSRPDLAGRADDPTTGTLRLVAMPGSVPPLDNVHCRRAVQYAVDKSAVKKALGGPFAAALSTALWPRGLPGYSASAAYPSGAGNRGDLAAAQRELAACGYPGGFSTALASVDQGRGLVLAETVQRSLARVGIRATVQRFPRGAFLATVVGSPASVKRSGFGLVAAEWGADFPSPYAFLVPLADGRSIRGRGNPNLAELSSSDVTQAVDEAAGALDPIQARFAWREVEAEAMRTAAYLPLVEDRALLIGSDRVRNAYVHPVYHSYDLASLGVR